MARQLDRSRFRVAFHGLPPAYAGGLAPALATRGGVVDQPEQLGAWLGVREGRVLVISADHEHFAGVLREVRAVAPAAPVMALLDGFSPRGFIRALRTGASTVGDARADLETLASKIESAAARWASLPFEALDELRELSLSGTGEAVAALTESERELLRALAEPVSVQVIAARIHLSDRTVYRHVKDVYRKLGVSTRLAAVAIAYRSGVLRRERWRDDPAS